MDMVRISGVEPSAGLAGGGPIPSVKITVTVRSVDLGRFKLDIHVPYKGAKDLNAEEARQILQRFCQRLSEVLKDPIPYEKNMEA